MNTKELPIVGGQRVYNKSDGEQMADEAIKTIMSLNSTLFSAAIKVYRKSLEQLDEVGFWGGWYPVAVCFWAGFLEGVRTQKQKDRQKKNRQTQAMSSGKANN